MYQKSRGKNYAKAFGLTSVLAATAIALSPARAEILEDCGSLKNAFGPWDYTNPAHTTQVPGELECALCVVERLHFNSDIENLIRGISSAYAIDDLDYTLRAFPNHHRALNSMAKYYLINGTNKKHGRYTIECWFERALRFKSDDAIVYTIYGIYLAKKGDTEDALTKYQNALKLRPNMIEAHYNLGLLYVQLKDYKRANEHAVKAYKAGYPLPGLRDKLKRLGAWDESVTQ